MQQIRQPLHEGLHYLLRTQMYSFLHQLPNDAVYTKLCPLAQGSVGGHVRHVSDHFHCLTSRLQDVHAYDQYRNRNSAVETSLDAAKTTLLELETRVSRIVQHEDLAQPIRVSFLTGGTDVLFESTLGRELSFCMHHAYHHCASMKMIASKNGFAEACPKDFGIAPSTAEYIGSKSTPQ